MNFSDEWQQLFPIGAVHPAPSLLPCPPSNSNSELPIHFIPLPQIQTLTWTLPFPSPQNPSLFPPLTCLRSILSDSFLPYSSLPSLLPSPSQSTPFSPSNVLTSLRLISSPPALLLLFPTGENSNQIAFLTFTSHNFTIQNKPSVQKDGFKHPHHRILHLLTTVYSSTSSWSPELNVDVIIEGYVVATTLYSANWFRVESRTGASNQTVLVPVAKQGFESPVVHASWSPHFSTQCVVLLENGQICWFDLDTKRGGKIMVSLAEDSDLGQWLSCAYGPQPWTVVVVSSKVVLLVDLRFGAQREHKVLMRVEMPGLYDGDPLDERNDRIIAFCKAGYDDFHMAVVTERQLMLFDLRRLMIPVLTWDHGLESPGHVAMFKLSELASSEEYEWALELGFVILVGSFSSDEFSLFVYGPKEHSATVNSTIYAWELPSCISLLGRHCRNANELVQELVTRKDSVHGDSSQQRKDFVVGYCILPNDLSVTEAGFSGFGLIRLVSSGKLELQLYQASSHSINEKSFDGLQHWSSMRNSSVCFNGQEQQVRTRYDLLQLRYLYEYMNGNLANALAAYSCNSNKEPRQIIVSDDVQKLAKELRGFCTASISDVTGDVSIPTSIFEIACRNILIKLPSDLVSLAFSKYSDMFTIRRKISFEFLQVPKCLAHNKIQHFLLAKPSSGSEKWSSKAFPKDAFVGPVLPIPVLLELEEREMEVESSSSSRETLDGDLLSHQCRAVLENVFPEVSIADNRNCNQWSSSQELNEKSFFLYEPEQIRSRSSCKESAMKIKKEDPEPEDPVLQSCLVPYKDENFTTFVCGIAEKENSHDSSHGPPLAGMFDLSPVRLDFESPNLVTPQAEEKIYKCLKRQFSKWQNGFKPYQDFCTSSKLRKTIL